LLLRIYFELNEYDALQAHFHSFSTYLRRKKDLGYHRELYLNLIRYTKVLIELAPKDKVARAQLLEEVQNSESVAEKEWLLQKLLRLKE